MKVLGLCGASGAGKTTVAEGLIKALREAGQRVSVVKHAHKRFDIDHPGKDSFRHREAGAFEVVIANGQRLALVREFEAPVDLNVDQLLAELADNGEARNWALVEGFKHASLLKLEVWRGEVGGPVLYPEDPYVVAVVTDAPDALPVATGLPVFTMGDSAALLQFLMQDAARYDYHSPYANESSDA